MASILKDQVRDSDAVARIGGDEFGMLLMGCPLDKSRQIADDICTAIRDYRFVWRDRIFSVGVSIGLVEIGRESGTVEDALGAADSACYVAKQQGRGRVHVYSARDEAVARQRGEIVWLQRLQTALKEDRFELYVQPIVSVSGKPGKGPACEILLRLKDSDDNAATPLDFMQAAERYHLMPNVDRWVLQTAFSAAGAGALKLPPGRSFSVNISGQTLADPQFLEFVVDCLDRTGVQPAQVCFEIPEAAVATNLNHAARFIAVLHGMGCQFALDDFGSGLGSFANLKQLALDYLKIDGSFIRGLGTDDTSGTMVAAMIELARGLGIKVVAEQVETQDAFDRVKAMRVDFVQGYIVGRPQPLPIGGAG
jgi:EAL domain-containing protein (putative c-di-GMP-specific phosphodiesterase class I)